MDLDYWQRLKRLKLMSLQRRRERYIIIHTWKIINSMAPNDIKMSFKLHQRRGIKVKLPALNLKAQKSVITMYDNSFGVHAAKLWNILPRTVNTQTVLSTFKSELGTFLDRFPDLPPTDNYPSTNNNSLLEWTQQRGYSEGGRATTPLS